MSNIPWLKQVQELKKSMGLETKPVEDMTVEEKASKIARQLEIDKKKREVAEKSATNRKKTRGTGGKRKDDIVKVALFERILKFLQIKDYYKSVAMSEDSKELIITTSQNIKYGIKITKKRG